MDPDTEVECDFPPYIRQYKSGRVERYGSADPVPAGTDTDGTGVSSRDVVIDPSTGLWARLYLPPAPSSAGRLGKLPVVVVLVVSPEYRLAPEHPLPTAYDDSWEAVTWVASHAAAGEGAGEPWLAEHGDPSRVFLAGASAGANIAHNMAVRAGAGDGEHGLAGAARVVGLLVVHPFFGGEARISEAEPEDREKAGAFWRFRCPGTPGLDDPLCNPFSEAAGGSAARIAGDRVLVCVAEKDALRDRGVWYYEGLTASGYRGEVALHESMGVGHVFHYADPECEQARALQARVLTFLRDQ
ncbi:hypothetical protein ACP70R_019107 [Stipagrostis hirtigluma subsp. patula]